MQMQRVFKKKCFIESKRRDSFDCAKCVSLCLVMEKRTKKNQRRVLQQKPLSQTAKCLCSEQDVSACLAGNLSRDAWQ